MSSSLSTLTTRRARKITYTGLDEPDAGRRPVQPTPSSRRATLVKLTTWYRFSRKPTRSSIPNCSSWPTEVVVSVDTEVKIEAETDGDRRLRAGKKNEACREVAAAA
ncbi:hypothetical protein TSAR_012098 [Trichomalopsis sarcophagae]|uniref:Uncharacterized protein n=1 Tax=Trichomalopsis sarcophagae TaxID=543379 RepID=A0A232EJG0_9HYME|nr:hypothetical protein TSAR_012098 [Trichomalopsis sarcophagae]